MKIFSCTIRIFKKVKHRTNYVDYDVSSDYPALTEELNNRYQSGRKLPFVGEYIHPDLKIVEKKSDNNYIYLHCE